MNQDQLIVLPGPPMDKPEQSKDLLRIAFIAVGSFFVTYGLLNLISSSYSFSIFQSSFESYTFFLELLMIMAIVTIVIGCLTLLVGFGKIGKSSSDPLKTGLLIIGSYLIYNGVHMVVQYLISLHGFALGINISTLTLVGSILAYLITGLVLVLASFGKFNPSFRY